MDNKFELGEIFYHNGKEKEIYSITQHFNNSITYKTETPNGFTHVYDEEQIEALKEGKDI